MSKVAVGGVLLAAGAAVGFASKGIFAKILYARGFSYDSVLTIRSLISLPLMWGWVLWRLGWPAIRRAPRSALWGASIGGIVCYGAGAVMNFYALTLVDASIERVVLFSYPAMIVIAGACMGRRAPSSRVVGALVLTYLGIFFTVGGFDITLVRANAIGVIFVLLCAMTYALYFLISERYVSKMGSQPFALIAMTAACAALNAWFALRMRWGGVHLAPRDVLIFAGLAMFATALPMFMAAEGVLRIGAQRAAMAGTIGPIATLVLAALLLGERLSPLQLAGSLLIIIGILVLELKPRPPVVNEAAT